MRLPNVENAFIDDEKLVGYSLNPDHERGKHKARVFASVLGITADKAYILRQAILNAIKINSAIPSKGDDYGQRYVVDFEMRTDVGTAIVRTTWILLVEEDFPRLVSCYVL